MTIKDLLETLNGSGLVLSDMEQVEQELNRVGMSLDIEIDLCPVCSGDTDCRDEATNYDDD